MTGGAAGERPHQYVTARNAATWRPWCLVAAMIVALGALVPPLATVARRADYGQALQFSFLAIALPALLTLGAPWRLLRLSSVPASGVSSPRVIDRLAARRSRNRDLPRALAFIVPDLVVIVLWHTPGAVAAAARDGWLVLLEAACLVSFGVALWLELIPSPPLMPRSGHLRRAVLAAIVMWVLWILAYVTGLSNHGFYPNFSHVPGGLGAAADQQIASAILWFVAAASFVPVIFWNAIMWLRTEDDPDTELLALLRAERRRGQPPLSGGDGIPSS
jgi:cytochrome c oxidase assembly factor CtaG